MTQGIKKYILLPIFAITLAIAVTGCSNHQKNRDTAMNKWNSARNNIALDLAGKQMENGQVDQAIATIQDVLTQSPDMVDGWLLLAQLYQQKDMPSKAVNSLEKALQIREDHPEANFQLGMIKELSGSNPEALAHYQKAIAAAPDNLIYIIAKAQLLNTIGQSREALAILENQINMGRPQTELYLTAGNIYLENQQYPEAVSMFKTALSNSPSNKTAADKLCYTLMKSGKYEQTIETIKKIQISQERQLDEHMALALGDCYLYSSQYIMAQRSYETMIHDFGPKEHYLIRLAQVTISRNDLARAESSCKRILANNPDNQEAILLLGIVYLKQKNYTLSQNLSEKVLANDNNSAMAWCILGRSYSGQGQLDKAKECYQKANTIAPNDPLSIELLKEVDQLQLSEIENINSPVSR